MKFSKSTLSFYDPALGGNIPSDAVDITDAQHTLLLAGQASGQSIVADATGAPVLQAPAAPTPDEIAAEYEAFGQTTLDALAKSWGYDSLLSAASYASSSVTQYAADAKALIAWRDAFWQAAFTLEADVKAGTKPMPATAADFVALMPAAPTRT